MGKQHKNRVILQLNWQNSWKLSIYHIARNEMNSLWIFSDLQDTIKCFCNFYLKLIGFLYILLKDLQLHSEIVFFSIFNIFTLIYLYRSLIAYNCSHVFKIYLKCVFYFNFVELLQIFDANVWKYSKSWGKLQQQTQKCKKIHKIIFFFK